MPDLEGTLYGGDWAISGAHGAIERFKQAGLTIRYSPAALDL